MTKLLRFFPLILAATPLLTASTTFVTGTPNFNNSGLTPRFGTLVNFDDPTLVNDVMNAPGNSFALPSNYYASLGVASISDPSGVFVQPYSTQSEPNFLTNGNASTNGEAAITIMLTRAQQEIGIGVADADGAPVTLNLLGVGGSIITSRSVTLPTDTTNAYNGYFAFIDSTSDIWGISVVQSSDLTSSFPSGVAVDDVQFAPEPQSVALVFAGVAALGFWRLRKRA